MQADIDAAVKMLLTLKAELKSATGKDFKPGGHIAKNLTKQADDLDNQITVQGNKVRDLKSAKGMVLSVAF